LNDLESVEGAGATAHDHGHVSACQRTFMYQGDHFPDHMEFPDFSPTFPVEASKDYPVSSVYRYGQQSLFHINEKRGEAR